MRKAGLLMPVSALPSDYGVGDFGKGSREFIDIMKECGLHIWQILPLNPLGYGNSPYQPYSSFAGDEIYLDLDAMMEEGLLNRKPAPFRREEARVDYEKVRAYKRKYLWEAFQNFSPNSEYEIFKTQEWVYPYAVFLTLKRQNGMKCWNEWKEEHKNWIKDQAFDISIYEAEICFEMFVQYEFYRQWKALKNYANVNKIEIMGDIPFYVGLDSLDVWMNQDEFLLGADGKPTYIAGVPPDYFSKDGQRWGNPIYDWERMKENGFVFWRKRFGYNARLFDIIRIDHFRAFDTYWKIPASSPTAREGEWIEAPGNALLDVLLKDNPDVRIVAEDLGDMRPQVYELRDAYHLPGMKIIQFTFDPMEHNNLFEDRENMIVYTGTHDNETIKGWFEGQPREVRLATERELYAWGYEEDSLVKNFICYTLDNKADTAILPVQDVLELDNAGRMNTPGTLGTPNWEWRLVSLDGLMDKKAFIRKALAKSGRVEGGKMPVRKRRRPNCKEDKKGI